LLLALKHPHVISPAQAAVSSSQGEEKKSYTMAIKPLMERIVSQLGGTQKPEASRKWFLHAF